MNFFSLLIVISIPLPVLAYLFRKLDSSKYLSLIPLSISILTLFHFLSCRVSTLLEWYWVNCALNPLERVVVALTLPQFYVPLIASMLSYFRKLPLSISASVLIASLLTYWSNYLSLNSSMMFSAPSIPPIGYGTIRSTFDTLYLFLFHLSIALYVSYLAVRKDPLLNLSASLASFSLALFAYYNLTTYGIPIPYSIFHAAYLVSVLSLVIHYLYRDKLSTLSIILASLVTISIVRLIPTDIASPYFADQRSLGIAFATLLLSSLYYLKLVEGLEVISLGVLVPSIALLAMALIRYYSIEAFQLVLTLSTLTLSIAYYKRCKYLLISPTGFLHYILASVIPWISFAVTYVKKRKFVESLEAALIVALALSIFYSSSAPVYFDLVKQLNVTNVKVSTVSSDIKLLNGTPRILNREVLVHYNTNSGNVSLRVNYKVPIYSGKYLPPGYEKSFARGIPEFSYLGSCAVALREESSTGLYSSSLRCYPLTLYLLISSTLLGSLVLIESLHRYKRTT
ncbi:hypothetical protein EYM_02105 [Ignicoccus islandicus DSM 13165]|uniref:Uncharacterized protein n=1 Tax=Ignicoccus islandicus DSM 13165 TaxID=940295 RepID=A0A0U2MAM3_9CREN|nr:hypothetical protein [Ignicoccus islandicus]ALU12285.1 hypothetical protein EYM_02105 [Ignicoccus islandicus DSM 13165]